MGTKLLRIKKRLTLLVAFSFGLTPVVGYSVAMFFGMVDGWVLFSQPIGFIMLALYFGLLVWATVHFNRFLNPIDAWLDKHPGTNALPDSLNQHLNSFTNNYWLFFLLYTLIIPTVQHWSSTTPSGGSAYASLLQFMLLQLVISVLVGMPGYLQAITTLGELTKYTGIKTVHVSLRTKMLLVGGYIPLLTTTALLNYYWWRTGFLNTEIILAWGLLGLIAFTVTLLAINSLKQSLRPVQKFIDGSGASSYENLAEQLRPQSTDELGYLIQALGRVFKRLSDQESYVNAIIDNAAEGIIVVNSDGFIETFNPAAEALFGYSEQEIRNQPLSWLLPELVGESCTPSLTEEVQEVMGKNRAGHHIPMSVRVSFMHMDNKTFYTCLIADISEQKYAEQKLMETERRYRNLVETAHDLVWSMDNKGRWTYFNNAAKRIYGYDPDEMIYKDFSEFQTPESQERDAVAMATVYEGKELLQYETVHLDKDGNEHHLSFNAKPLLDSDGNVSHITGTARDITEQKAFERELTYQAQHDTLTGLYNRNYFQQELDRLVTRVARSGADCALFYLDLDQFKYVNDTVGHAAGDRLLLQCTNLLKQNIREGDLLARFGGDEFTILLYNVDADYNEHVAENIRNLFESFRFLDSGKAFNVTCSIGIADINSNTVSSDEVMAQADLACNIAKSQGRNCVHRYNPEDKEKDGMAEDIGWATRVRDAVDNDRFELVYQPIVSIADGCIHDYEVLLRLPMGNGEHIMPGGFMPAAERFGLMHYVDRWTVTHALQYLAELHSNDQYTRFAINLSSHAFGDRELLPLINGILRDTGIEPSALTFEITETAAIANMQAAIEFIYSLKDMGCQFALDDFGSGFCSFTYLKHLPVDKLKIDGSFIQGLPYTIIDQAMVKSMNQIAHALGKQTIAEYVEDEATLNLLQEYGVDFAQGHYLGRPSATIKRNQMDLRFDAMNPAIA